MAENGKKSFRLDVDPVIKRLQSIRRLIMAEKINEESIDNLVNQLLVLGERSTDPIELLIDSHGGDPRQVLHLADIIDALPAPVDCVIVRHAHSAALDLVQCCRHRYALPRASIFSHCGGTSRDIKSTAILYEEGMKRVAQQAVEYRRAIHKLYIKRAGMTLKGVEKMELLGTLYDVNIPLPMAIKLKLIDKVTTKFQLFKRTKL